jgi:site-specific DNA recombinase
MQTPKGQQVSRQTFAKMLRNPFYAGWVVSRETRVKVNHEPLISQELFDTVQERLAGNTNGKIVHKKVNEDFPLRGFVKCVGCGKNLTAAWSRGKGGERFPYYFCWNRDCKNKVYVSREQDRVRVFLAALPSLG